MPELNLLGAKFAGQLQHIQSLAVTREQGNIAAEKVHVVGAGTTLSTVYEQLRNAAEYTEEHLLLQRAIRRFYQRLYISRAQGLIESSGEELIVELTLAGYVKNDSVPIAIAKKISKLATEYYDALINLGNSKDASTWTLNVLAVEIESLINDHDAQTVFAQFAHDYFVGSIDQTKVFGGPRPDFEVALFVAVHRALLHSDSSTVRALLLKRYGISPGKNLQLYKSTNEQIDKLLGSEEVEKLFRLVNRQGAPFRVLWRMVEDQPNTVEFLRSKDKFLRAYETQINHEYDQIHHRINRGIVKSIVFLVITKFLVGIAIEVPYDYAVHGAIMWTPLLINLLFPPIYMLLLRATLVIPGSANTVAMCDLMGRFLYGSDEAPVAARRSSRSFGVAYNFAYALVFLLVFSLVTWLLVSLGFSLVHLMIFFIFLSTASFLGFRLSGMIRELEVVDTNQGGITVVRDFLYMPFVVVGRWISEKYSKMNVIATFLDLAIELPLKTVLRLVRQWSAFISSKKDEL